MNRTPVTSTDIAEVGYDMNSMTLEIAFNQGGIYQYFDVPDAVYKELMGAASHGKFFHANIKNNYRYVKV